MKERLLVPERMDDPALSKAEHLRALRGLRRINRCTGNARAAWQPVRQLAKASSAQNLTLLDVATGAGDVPLRLLRYAAASGIQLKVDACDLSRTALDFVSDALTDPQQVNLFELNIVSESIPQEYDIVMCTTFLHHLSESDATLALQKMRDAARKRVVIVDLERGALNWMLVWLGCHLLTRSPVVRFDGPQSVRAAFTIDEIRKLAADIGFKRLRVQRSWPARFVLVGDV